MLVLLHRFRFLSTLINWSYLESHMAPSQKANLAASLLPLPRQSYTLAFSSILFPFQLHLSTCQPSSLALASSPITFELSVETCFPVSEVAGIFVTILSFSSGTLAEYIEYNKEWWVFSFGMASASGWLDGYLVSKTESSVFMVVIIIIVIGHNQGVIGGWMTGWFNCIGVVFFLVFLIPHIGTRQILPLESSSHLLE